jgi:hypothetical protein
MGVVAVVIGIFFVAGLFVGAVVVIALPALRARGFRRPGRRGRAAGPVQPPDDRPRWPGDANTGSSGR